MKNSNHYLFNGMYVELPQGIITFGIETGKKILPLLTLKNQFKNMQSFLL